MKLLKLERISTIKPSIVRVTYKTWYGKIRVRDAMLRLACWSFIDTGKFIYQHDHYLSEFYISDFNVYVINKQLPHFPPPPQKKQLMKITSKDFQFTLGEWIGVEDSGVSNEFDEQVFATGCGCQTEPYLSAHDALLISKAPNFAHDALKDIVLYEKILNALPEKLEHLRYSIEKRKQEKETLLQSAIKI